MDLSTLAYFTIIAAMVLTALGLIVIAWSGAKSVGYGKIEGSSIAVLLVPLVLLVVLGFVFQGNATMTTMEAWSQAGIITVVIMIGLCLVALLWSGVRGIFN